MAKRIDQKDIDILNILQANCRIRLQPMADKVGLTTSPVADRIVMLERSGFIRRYGAVVNKCMFGLDYRAFVRVQLSREKAIEFEAVIGHFHEVESAFQLSDNSFLLLVAVRDAKAYSQFILQRLQATGMVADIQTMVLKNEVKTFASLPGSVLGSEIIKY